MERLAEAGAAGSYDPERELRELISALFHDLREPLRTIQVSIDLLRVRGRENEDYAGLMSLAGQNTARILKLIDDFEILAWTGASAPGAEVEMNDVLESAKAALDALIRTSGATITSTSLPRVQGDEAALGRVFQNLLSNAMKYRREEPPVIDVSCSKSEPDWTFSVRDNGIGISADDSSGIFAAFRRLHPQGATAGNGLGLAICRRVVERHGGRIWLESTPGQGSTFCFTLPSLEARRAEYQGDGKRGPASEKSGTVAQNPMDRACAASGGGKRTAAAA
jgi:light-regulated signal transduction histidine kinase (bacteriophytochrome)